jgi:hypothetical protein
LPKEKAPRLEAQRQFSWSQFGGHRRDQRMGNPNPSDRFQPRDPGPEVLEATGRLLPLPIPLN